MKTHGIGTITAMTHRYRYEMMRRPIMTYGKIDRSDITVTINNVMVSFLSLLAAPWC